MLNHLPPLHDQKHFRSSACRHHCHHGALPNAQEDHEDLGSSVTSSWCSCKCSWGSWRSLEGVVPLLHGQPTVPPRGLTRVSPGINVRIAAMMMMMMARVSDVSLEWFCWFWLSQSCTCSSLLLENFLTSRQQTIPDQSSRLSGKTCLVVQNKT